LRNRRRGRAGVEAGAEAGVETGALLARRSGWRREWAQPRWE